MKNKNLIILITVSAIIVFGVTLILAKEQLTSTGGKCTVFCKDGSKVSCEGENTATFKEKDDEGCKCDEEVVRCSDNAKTGNKNTNSANRSNPESNKNDSNKNDSNKNVKKKKKEKKKKNNSD